MLEAPTAAGLHATGCSEALLCFGLFGTWTNSANLNCPAMCDQHPVLLGFLELTLVTLQLCLSLHFRLKFCFIQTSEAKRERNTNKMMHISSLHRLGMAGLSSLPGFLGDEFVITKLVELLPHCFGNCSAAGNNMCQCRPVWHMVPSHTTSQVY